MLKIALITLPLLATFCVEGTLVWVPIKHSIRVELMPPWYIVFTVPQTDNFMPLTLSAKAGAVPKAIEFTSYKEKTNRIFRNTFPLADVNTSSILHMQLGYSDADQELPQQIDFEYKLSEKQFDVVNINVPTLLSTTSPGDDDGLNDLFDRGNSEESQPGAQPNNKKVSVVEVRTFQTLYETALAEGLFKRRLKLTGSLPPGNNAVDGLRELFIGKLQLSHLTQNIVQAHFKSYADGSQAVIFEMKNDGDAIEVLNKSANTMQRRPFVKIESTDEYFVDGSKSTGRVE